MKKIVLLAGFALIMASCGGDKKDYDATGTFEATEVTVSAESSGQLLHFNVSEGQVLKGGLSVGQIRTPVSWYSSVNSSLQAMNNWQQRTVSWMQTSVN